MAKRATVSPSSDLPGPSRSHGFAASHSAQLRRRSVGPGRTSPLTAFGLPGTRARSPTRTPMPPCLRSAAPAP
eukprot:scaffold57382_cov24-Tisochrysis_lutea.AAC.1